LTRVMSTVLVCIGQCGNQLGAEYLSHQLAVEPSVVSDALGNVRAVFVDSERKVVQSMCRKYPALRGRVPDANCVTARQGRGNNWAYGYSASGDEALCAERLVDDCIRRVGEQCDYFSGVLLAHSLAGGTGSGLGTRLAECVRDSLGLQLLAHCCVLADRDTPLQNYNSLLALSRLAGLADCMLLYRNSSEASPAQVNESVASHLSRLLFPCRSLYKSCRLGGNELAELTRSCCPLPGLSLLRTASANDLPCLLRCRPRPASTVAAVAVLRSPSGSKIRAPKSADCDALKAYLRPVAYNAFPVDYWMDSGWGGGGSSLTLAYNSVSVVDWLVPIATKSAAQLSAGAYLHHYERYLPDAREALRLVSVQFEDLIAGYRSMR
ncbi:hypothetical protein BOX15_Mlig023198g1, partial [Macrostomum lignano]